MDYIIYYLDYVVYYLVESVIYLAPKVSISLNILLLVYIKLLKRRLAITNNILLIAESEGGM